MQRFKALLFLAALNAFSISQAADFIAADIGEHTTMQVNGPVSNTFMSDEPVKMDFELQIAPEDRGVQRSLYLVAVYQGIFYLKTEEGRWMQWDGQSDSLIPYKKPVLGEKEKLEVLAGERLDAGEYLVFAGYQSAKGNILYSATPAAFAVFDQGSAALHHIQHSEMLDEYLALGAIPGSGPQPAFAEDDASAALDPTSSPDSVSQTNLQEQGVDEADRIKTNGNTLFALEKCPGQNGECLSAYEMIEFPASTRKLGQISVSSNPLNGQIYLHHASTSQRFIIWVSNTFVSPVIDTPEIFPYPDSSRTEIKFIDASSPGAMKVIRSLSIDGSLVSSRMLNDTLYLATQEEPLFFPGPVPLAVIEEGNERTSPAESRLPSIIMDDSPPAPLVEATDCFIPPKNGSKNYDSRLAAVTAIPIDSPENHKSLCIAGSIETIYASTHALYLATSRYPNWIQGNAIVYDPNPEYQTDIHKFSFSGKSLEYTGSGLVPGHLGWEADKKSFRMGEYNNILRIATSLGETWNDTSRSRVALLKEGSNGNLQEISHLDNLGKPGEKLYAARFIGNRGYLVTFKVTDPLIMLDLSNPISPKILGELEINGYSDYLHPIGENFLLGIGKDAIPDPIESRGAWYQGLKLALFDVSNGNNLSEINSIILGKRGTSSAILFDHHALSWLPASATTTARLAIPVDLHDIPYPTPQFNPADPSTFYDWTHTGLYTFTVNTSNSPGIALEGRLITDSKSANDQRYFNSLHDRSVIQGDTVHYIHNDAVFSSATNELQ